MKYKLGTNIKVGDKISKKYYFDKFNVLLKQIKEEKLDYNSFCGRIPKKND